jgi:hypothetical protein
MSQQVYARGISIIILSLISGWLMQLSTLSDRTYLATLNDSQQVNYLLEFTYIELLPNIGLMFVGLIFIIALYEYLSFLILKLLNRVSNKESK